jgi:hypothetical protein
MEPKPRHVRNRGLLTEDDRAYYQGDKNVENETEVRNEKRHNIKERIRNTIEDLAILAGTDDEDLVDYFHANTDRAAKLEAELAALRQQLDEDTSDD